MKARIPLIGVSSELVTDVGNHRPSALRKRLLAAFLLSGLSLYAADFEAVASRTAPDYFRRKLANGTYAPETYAFGKGGYSSGPISDVSIASMSFLDVAHVIAEPLASQEYLPATDPRSANLLIMVYWGTTYGQEHASESESYQRQSTLTQKLADLNSRITHGHDTMLIPVRDAVDSQLTTAVAAVEAENRMRDNSNYRTALMLGYESWWANTVNAGPGTSAAIGRADMMNELEESRYFVVLMAYDFQLLSKKKVHKLLWETRFSIREHVNRFDQQLAAMTLEASKYFGQPSDGLKHDPLPEGKVDIGPIKDLGPSEQK